MGMAIGQAGAQMIGQGIHQLFYGDPAARAKAQAEAAARQQLQDVRLDASRTRLLTGDGGLAIKRMDASETASARQIQPSYAILTPESKAASSAPPASHPPSAGATSDEGYVRGQTDAADCLPQNAGGFCAGSEPKKTAACVASYQNGYALGEPAAMTTLRAAYDEGVAAKALGKAFSTFSHPTQGACGVRQANVYTAGYYGWPFTTLGR
jgi:hypothetical protein